MAVSKSSLFSKKSSTLARYAKALSHPARLAILETLASRNSCICGEIVKVLPLAQSTVSQHLKELKNAGLIQGQIDGPTSCYCLNADAVKEFEQLTASMLQLLNKKNKLKKCC